MGDNLREQLHNRLLKQDVHIQNPPLFGWRNGIYKVDVIQLIKELQQGFLSESKSREINFVLNTPFEKLEIEADKEKLDTIVYNLLSNAYKYISNKGEIKITFDKTIISNTNTYSNQLSFGEITCDEFVEFTEEDTGTGIDNEDLLNIFNRFEQGKPNGTNKLR